MTNEGMHVDDESKGRVASPSDRATPEQRWAIQTHLQRLANIRGATVQGAFVMALGIIDDPQAHVDALVAAGVLTPIRGDSTMKAFDEYRVVHPPHDHDWRVDGADSTVIYLRCTGYSRCGGFERVSNKLPIVVPDA